MAQKNIRAAGLARSVKLPATTISNWLAGQKPRDIEQIRIVAEYFDVSIEYLCFGKENKKTKIEENMDLINAGVFEVLLRRAVEGRGA